MSCRRPSPREPVGDRLSAAAPRWFPVRKSRGVAAESGACRTAATHRFFAPNFKGSEERA